MRRLMTSLTAAIARFRSDERASLSVETVIIFPLLAWVYIGMFTYFDSFRAQSQSDKATYTIADMLSREQFYITPLYMDTLWELHGMLTRDNNPTKLRVSVLEWNDTRDRYLTVWSEGRGDPPPLTDTDLWSPGYRDRLPDGLPDGEQVILVEAWTIYEPPFDLGRLISDDLSGSFGAVSFDTFTVIRSRFTSQLCWNTVENGDTTTATC